MLNRSTPVASRTRSRRDAELIREYKKRKTQAAEENTAVAESSGHSRSSENISVPSSKETEEVEILTEDFDDQTEEFCKRDEPEEEAHVVCLESSDDDDVVSEEGSDDPVTSTSGEDNDDSEDLDYGEEDQPDEETEEDEGEFVSEHNGAETCPVYDSRGTLVGRKRLDVLVDEDDSGMDGDDSGLDDDDSDFTSSKTMSRCREETTSAKPMARARASSSRKLDLLKILADSILAEEDSGSTFEEVRGEESNHKSLPEQTEYEKEMDALWAEMQFCLTSSEIGSTHPSMVENEDADNSQVHLDTATLCRQGNHQLILDEEIGMKCKFCSFMQLEIKYIAPPFMTHPYGKFERQHSGMVDSSIFDGLQYQDSDSDMLSCDPCADIQGTVWEIIPPNIKSQLHRHQREGFEFIWNNIAGGIYLDKTKNKSSGGGGCVISHAPGTGKTLVTIVFLYTYLKEYPSCRPVIVAPRSMLLTWEAEFRKWKVDIPFHNLNSPDFSGKEKTKTVGLYEKFKLHVPDRCLARRLVKLLSWKSDGGILGISYSLFKQLAGRKDNWKRKRTNIDKLVSRILIELPGLFVLDEGHTPRNNQTLMWKALSGIKTERRIILSGTPFQNNFKELFTTLHLVRPKFTEEIPGSHQERVDRRCGKGNEAKQKWYSLIGSSGKDDRVEAENLKCLRAVIKPFVHVHKGTILQTSLPGLRHSVVVLQPSDLQKKILELLKETKNALSVDYYVSLISVHPSLLLQLSDLKGIVESVDSIVSKDELERIRLKPDSGVKTKFLKELLKLSEALNEKVIVFSQFLEPLNLIMDQLKDFFKWKEGEEILYMHGKCDVKQRQSLINVFNDPTSKARVLLASTKACSEGINLVGGSRVVLLDVTWNPSVERQAISRAYRLGQKKVVYTYHLISSGTMEGLKCYRQAGKDRLSELVFSSGDDHQKKVSDVLEDKILEEMFQHQKLKSMFEKIINQPKDSDLIATFGDL